jgi:electron transport complex protein RnfC
VLISFKGGIHPPENKRITENIHFSNLSVPHLCYIPLQQHTGKPAKPVVQIGDIVQEGQLIGEADGFISANVHASVPGRVVEIKEHPTLNSKKDICVVIEAEGAFSTFHETASPIEWDKLDKNEIINEITNAGIVGLGGAAFPTAVKLSPPESKKIDALIINGAECEPYLTVDDMLMRTFPREIIEGIRITLRALGIDRAYIGIENNKSEAISALKRELSRTPLTEKIEVNTLRTKYPQGAEKQLIYSILKREVPSGGLPMDSGTVVQNVGTVYAIREAIILKKPLFERYMTITGKIVHNPGNYKIRVGTRISDLVEDCGGLKESPVKIIMGGPMCGISLDSMDIPVVKGTSGILFLGKDEVAIEDYHACVRCGKCVSACPVNLLPNELGTAMEKGRMDIVEKLNPFDCIMCGCCSYICPSKRPLSHFIKLAQEKLRKRK